MTSKEQHLSLLQLNCVLFEKIETEGKKKKCIKKLKIVLEEMEQCIAPEVVGTFSFSFVINEFVSRL